MTTIKIDPLWVRMLKNDHEFEQMIAEAVEKLGTEIVFQAIEPFSDATQRGVKMFTMENREKIIFMLATMLEASKHLDKDSGLANILRKLKEDERRRH